MKPQSVSQGILKLLGTGIHHTAYSLEVLLLSRYGIRATGSSVTAKIRWLRDTKKKNIVCTMKMINGKKVYRYRLIK